MLLFVEATVPSPGLIPFARMSLCYKTASAPVVSLVNARLLQQARTSHLRPFTVCAYPKQVRSDRRLVPPVPANQSQTNSAQENVDKLLAAADELLQRLGSNGSNGSRSALELPAAPSDAGGLVLQCDVNGCTIVPRKKDEPQDAAGNLVAPLLTSNNPSTKPEDYKLLEGDGWKIGFQESPQDAAAYTAVIASKCWSMALTHEEFVDFMQLLYKLKISVATLKVCGDWGTGKAEMDEASLEMNTGRVWMQASAEQRRLSALQDMWSRRMSGQPDTNNLPDAAFALRFIIMSPDRREVEGSWNAEVVLQVLDCLDKEDLAFPLPSDAAAQLAGAASYR